MDGVAAEEVFAALAARQRQQILRLVGDLADRARLVADETQDLLTLRRRQRGEDLFGCHAAHRATAPPDPQVIVCTFDPQALACANEALYETGP